MKDGTRLASVKSMNPNRFRRGSASNRPWIIAHRGDSFHAPENTLEAALKGWEAGADAWELDVQLTHDGVPIVLHDASLIRTTDVLSRYADDPRGRTSHLVADFDLEEIRALDAGSWFLDPGPGPRTSHGFGTYEGLGESDRGWYASGRVRVPTLAEALAFTHRLDWCVNLELKTQPGRAPALVDAVLALIGETGTAQRVEISSFDHAAVARVVRLAPEVATGVLVVTTPFRPHAYVREWIGADAYHPSAQALGADSASYRRSPSADSLRTDDLSALRAADVPVFVYTVNDATEGGLADHLADAGVSGLFADDPGALAARWKPLGRSPI